MKYDFKQLHQNEENDSYPFTVKGYKQDGYGRNSVCFGMTRIDFLDCYKTQEEAIAEHPELVMDGEINWGSWSYDEHLKDVSHIPDIEDNLY